MADMMTSTRSNSAFLAMIVVISLTFIPPTSSPSISTMRSPGLTLSARTDDVRTPLTTVPRESVRLASMMPSLPGGAMTSDLDRSVRAAACLADAEMWRREPRGPAPRGRWWDDPAPDLAV